MRTYGEWAGNPVGVPEDPSRCAWELYSDYVGRQCSRKRGHGPGAEYCKTHGRMQQAIDDRKAGIIS